MTAKKRPEATHDDPLVPASEALSFEEALKRLEAVVSRLEAGDLPLEESLAAFEEGVLLTKLCSQRLSEAERKVNILLRDAEGIVEERPFEEGSGGERVEDGSGEEKNGR